MKRVWCIGLVDPSNVSMISPYIQIYIYIYIYIIKHKSGRDLRPFTKIVRSPHSAPGSPSGTCTHARHSNAHKVRQSQARSSLDWVALQNLSSRACWREDVAWPPPAVFLARDQIQSPCHSESGHPEIDLRYRKEKEKGKTESDSPYNDQHIRDI